MGIYYTDLRSSITILSALFLPLRIALAILSFVVTYEFLYYFSKPVKYDMIFFICIVSLLYINLGSVDIFTILIVPIKEY